MRAISILVLIAFTNLFDCSAIKAEIPTISILTCDSGDQLYSTFGHTGVRVLHEETKYDVVYGYGTFDTSQSGFYLKFMQGKLLYYVSASSYKRFIAEYKYDQRDVVEQVLHLDSLQVYQMIDFLENNIKKENRFYKYDFFFDNCSTRIRDIFDSEYNVTWKEEVDIKTFRNQLDEKLVPLVWADFGIDIAIGAVADQISDYKDQMFLPAYMMHRLDEATIDGRPIVKEKKSILAFTDAKTERWKVPFITPFKVFSIVLSLVLLLFLVNNPVTQKILKVDTFLWFLGMAICSALIIFLWFFTDHLATKQNWNLLWMNPLFIVGLLGYRKLKVKSVFSDVILYGIIGFNILSLVVWGLIPQQWHIAFLPMMLTSVVMALGFLRSRKVV